MSSTANTEQIAFWKEQAGQSWVENQPQLDEQLQKFGTEAIDALAPQSGEHIIDVGCGCGETTLELARRVGPTGSATGVDLSTVMLERALQRAASASLDHARFEELDAQTGTLPAKKFDGLCSRFGVMFFDDSVAAFSNLRSSLKDDGRLSFVCWQPLSENPWMLIPALSAMELLTLSPPDPNAPGPFAFGDNQRVTKILGDAGFTSIHIRDLHTTMSFGKQRSLADVADFLVNMGPVARALREANDAALTAKVVTAVTAGLEPHVGDNGVEMDAAVWIVTAKAS